MPTTHTPHLTPIDGSGRRNDGVDRMTQSVTRLLGERHDLVGVHPLADLIHDAVRWCA